ncbi:MAG: hypothetical protein WCZ43_04405 [Proteiniphilum sp.]
MIEPIPVYRNHHYPSRFPDKSGQAIGIITSSHHHYLSRFTGIGTLAH